MEYFLLLIFLIFSIYAIKVLLRKDFLFAIIYLVFFSYCFFSLFSYVYIPEEVASLGKQYYGELAFYPYLFYCFLFHVLIFLFFLYKRKDRKGFEFTLCSVKKDYLMKTKILYHFIIVSFIVLYLFFLCNTYSSLSYYNQTPLKANPLFFYMFELMILLIIFLFHIARTNIEYRKSNCIYLLIISLLFIITALKCGQRIQLLSLAMGLIVYYICLVKGNFNIKRIIVLSAIILMLIFLLQLIRLTRGNFSNISIQTIIDCFSPFLNLRFYLFQDWFYPPLSLVTAIQKDLITPFAVIISNISIMIPLIPHTSLGSTMSNIVDPIGNRGYGYYYITEGYQFLGGVGVIIYAAFLIALYNLFFKIFTFDDCDLNILIKASFATFILSLVRSQSFSFIKQVVFWFLPILFLYFLFNGKYPTKKRGESKYV
ncbi:MAG: O-antigen polymerase [Bacilli bacterium]